MIDSLLLCCALYHCCYEKQRQTQVQNASQASDFDFPRKSYKNLKLETEKYIYNRIASSSLHLSSSNKAACAKSMNNE
jgi:hypothetical protein